MGLNKQLFVRARPDFELVDYLASGNAPVMKVAGYLPLPNWPDGTWCYELASYYGYLAKRGLSLQSRGGSIASYASMLSHITRFCALNSLRFLDVTDSRYQQFIKNLIADKRVVLGVSHAKREAKQVCEIGKITLGFLSYVGIEFGRPDFVSEDGTIRAERRLYVPKDLDGRKVGKPVRYWWHPSFPVESAIKRRHPISDEYIQKLRLAVSELGGSAFLRKRRFLMLRMLENSGCRRIELVEIRVSEVKIAKADSILNNRAPMLRMKTFKSRGGPKERLVELTHSDLDACIEFADRYRRPLIEGKGGDHDKLFISASTGEALLPNTITQEINILRKFSGIKGRAHPHLFRHRYITNLLVKFIRSEMATRLASRNPDALAGVSDFMREFLNVNAFKAKVMQYTGHVSEASIAIYVDWAYAKLSNYNETIRNVKIQNVIESIELGLAEIEAQKDDLSDSDARVLLIAKMKSLILDMQPLEASMAA